MRNEKGDTVIDATEIEKLQRLLWIVHQQTGQPRSDGDIPRHVQPTKAGRERKSEQTVTTKETEQ